MKKIFYILLSLIIFLSFGTYSFVSAQDTPEVEQGISPSYLPPAPDGRPSFLGQSHSYSVIFRGNGEAVVNSKVIFTNSTNSDLSEISLRVPQVSPEDFVAYQVIKEKVCLRYNPLNYQECFEYGEPDYFGYRTNKYQKADYGFEGDTLTVKLPNAIAPDSNGSFFIHFRSFGYAKKNLFGAYTYTFETFKVNDEINSLVVGITTDSDLNLKGVSGKVAYRYDEPSFSGLEASSAPVKDAGLDRFYQQIGQGRIVKSASSLAPLESYKVEGSYAKSKISLYAKELAIGIGGTLVVLGVVIGVVVLLLKRINKSGAESQATPNKKLSNLPLALALSFVSSILTAGYTALIVLAISLLMRNVYYSFQPVILLFLLVISIGVYAILIFAPGVYVGVKKSFGWGLVTSIITIVLLVLYLAITILVLFLFYKPSTVPPITPLMEMGV
jgi:hypothetical protein